MPSIERVRATTLSLLGLGEAATETSAFDPDPTDSPSAASNSGLGTPIIEAVETALREAGYLAS